MQSMIKKELKEYITITNILIIIIGSLAPTLYILSQANNQTYLHWLGLYSNSVGSFQALLFPLFIVILTIPKLSTKLSNKFISYVRIRKNIYQYLGATMISNAIIVFVGSFLLVFIPFIITYYIVPIFGLIGYQPESMGLNTVAAINNDIATNDALSFLINVSPLFYAIVYAAWVGFNGILWYIVSWCLLIIKNNIFLALSIPFVVYQIAHFLFSLLGVPQFGSLISIFPFNFEKVPVWNMLLFPMLLIVGVISMLIYIYKNIEKMDSLS
ncbi:hypothetical protein ACP0AK_06420 [Listeria ivanovii]|uniref:Putative ABC transporter (Permease) n=1 Tax=Listeria ivanovii (strain ATCC BAA-678 / PAM 55) TaxID=881621 RepID=G2ZB96_LISIP|nr:hypothetical protein [Listeria ivanovii]AHI57241.1 hypothetical protein AX25_02505 [Listeria ivanovii WSLC3009]AIS64478.1 hypothetical protein JL52_02445 [Listeria ivanovii subsp. ivanovii]MBC1758851.1 hypothetical protein [Listeria ivanovii]MCJ1716767.1 hypothetical protein [Listeria ivanovii]MCJ1721326.1 hypothetical protein [Listeria ivanovii]